MQTLSFNCLSNTIGYLLNELVNITLIEKESS